MSTSDGNSIRKLAAFLRSHGDSILNSELSKLCLTTHSLSEISAAFHLVALDDPERHSFNVLHCDAGSQLIQDLLFLHDLLQKTLALKLVPSATTLTGGICLHKFIFLRHLEFVRVPPHLVKNIGNLAHQLETLEAHRCLSSIKPLLCLSDNLPWRKLTTLRLSHNVLTTFSTEDHHYLSLLPSLNNLDLSHNTFAELNLEELPELKVVDLSFNFIETIPTFHRRACLLNLCYLSLRNNLLEDLFGVENLAALKVLDMGFNMISEYAVLEPLASLLSLDRLCLEGNPISLHREYKVKVSCYIAKTILLDDYVYVHSDRVEVINMPLPSPSGILDANLEGIINASPLDTASVSESTVSLTKPIKKRRPVTIRDPSPERRDDHGGLLSSSVEARKFKTRIAEQKTLHESDWLVKAATSLSLPCAQSTPIPKQDDEEDRARRISKYSEDDVCVVIEDDIQSDTSGVTLTQIDIEIQPKGACPTTVMTTSQTESAGDIIDGEDQPLPVESDKEESPAIGVLDADPDMETVSTQEVDVSSSNFVSAVQSNDGYCSPDSAVQSNATESDDTSSFQIDCENSLWQKLKEQGREGREYDLEHQIDTDSKMHLEMVVFGAEETFLGAIRSFIVFRENSFNGYVVLSNLNLYIMHLNVKTEGHVANVPLSHLTAATTQIGSQSLVVEFLDGWVLCYIGDSSWCSQFVNFLNLRSPSSMKVTNSELNEQDILASLGLEEDAVMTYAQAYWSLLDDKANEAIEKSYVCLAVTSQDIIVVRERHFEPEKIKFEEVCSQTIANLTTISVDEKDNCVANITFTDEPTGREQVWFVQTASVASMYGLLHSLKQPWQELFDVEIPLTYI